VALLTDDQVAEALASLPEWTRHGNRIERQLVFPSFADAVAFLVRLAFDAEAADHHPDATISYRRLTLAYTTHSEGGLTRKDVEQARRASTIAAGFISDKADR
jgi:4a-hydroxytetrahydrobiopterin dehydratase